MIYLPNIVRQDTETLHFLFITQESKHGEMNKISYTKEATNVIIYSKEEAARTDAPFIMPEHILLGIIRDDDCHANTIIKSLYADLKKIRTELEEAIRNNLNETGPEKVELKDLYFDDKSTRVLRLCLLESKLHNKDEIGSEHILLGIMKEEKNNAAQILMQNNITYEKIIDRISGNSASVPSSGLSFDENEEEDDGIERRNWNKGSGNFGNFSRGNSDNISQTQKEKTDNGDNKLPFLNKFGIDLTQAAARGKLDKVVGREKEIERVTQILCRRKKNNPVLIGEPGVGKSAIVEGLAARIAEKKVPRILFDKIIIMLDLTSVVAGTKYRGEFEERIIKIINEAKSNKNVILFIDEIHTIIGAGSAAGSMDAANILKPSLARGELQCIGATTLDEYRKSIEKDGALERRFQKVNVEPTTKEETLQILMNIKEQYEDYHNVRYTDEAIKTCVELTDRYITDRFFPDKAIDAIDEAGSRIHLMNVSVPKEIEEQERLIKETNEHKNEAIKLQNYELAAGLRDKEKMLQNQLEIIKKEVYEKSRQNRETVNKENIEEIVSLMSGVPLKKVGSTEANKLKHMQETLTSKVIGQNDAVEKLVKAIKRSRVGLKDPNKPIGTFLFTGPTGVGKTHLAKILGEELFGSKDSLIRIDMSEYMEKYAVSRMVGAPPGYIGYDEGGQLTEKVRRKPYSIVLLDEIEKAHHDVFNFLLQIMDEGRLTDSTGRTVDFKNTVIIMTSNVGSRQLKEFGKGIGFNAISRKDDEEHSNDIIRKALEKTFAPEFINRLDDIIPFKQLNHEDLVKITEIELNGLFGRISNLGYNISITERAKSLIARKGEDTQYGARPIKRAIQNNIEDKLAEYLVETELSEGCRISVDTDEEEKEIVIKTGE